MEKDNLQLPLKYDKVDPEEIIAKLKQILNYLQNKSKEDKLENGQDIPNTLKN